LTGGTRFVIIILMNLREIDGYENYLISDTGRVFRKRDMFELTPKKKQKDYIYVELSKNGKPKRFVIHRLVAFAFCENADKTLTVNHKDGNKTNNNASNLEWVTIEQNNIHAFQNGLKQSKLSKEDVLALTEDYRLFIEEQSKKYSVIDKTIKEIIKNPGLVYRLYKWS
jgi:hypothetical protein